MLRATDVIAAGAADPSRIVDSVILDLERRRRPEGACRGVGGTAFVLALASPVSLRMGDALVLENGDLVEVVAEAEPLLEVRADPGQLARLAWALGDRHQPVEIRPNRLRVQPGPQVEALIAKLGLRAIAIEAPFDPEGGAYASAPHGHHHHGHDHHGHHHHHHDHHHHHHHHDHGHHHHGHDHAEHHHDHGACGCGQAGPASEDAR